MKSRKALFGKLRSHDLFADQEVDESAVDEAEDLDKDDADTEEVEA
ncbi:MAG: hypothetical protein R3C01_11995 [Planctomycetaceae bacterium]